MKQKEYLAKETTIVYGGLMRCCTATISEYIKNNPNKNLINGFILDCKYEATGNKNIIMKNGVWGWNK